MTDPVFEEVTFLEEDAAERDEETDLFVSTRPIQIPVTLARSIADPLENPPWAGISWNGLRDPAWCPGHILEIAKSRSHDVRAAQVADPFAREPVRHHMERIAWLVNNEASDEITILATVGPREWPLADGNHRLAAAILAEREMILARFVGMPGDIEEIFTREGLHPPVFEQVSGEEVDLLRISGSPPDPDHGDMSPEF